MYGMSKLLHLVIFEPTDPMWSQNKATEALNSVAIEQTDTMWSQNKTTKSLCSVVAVERTTEWYTANEASPNRSTNSVLDDHSTNKSRKSRS